MKTLTQVFAQVISQAIGVSSVFSGRVTGSVTSVPTGKFEVLTFDLGRSVVSEIWQFFWNFIWNFLLSMKGEEYTWLV